MVTLNIKCPQCGKINKVQMTENQYYQYKKGNSFIQDIFPDWSPEKRELLITGICSECWNKIFDE